LASVRGKRRIPQPDENNARRRVSQQPAIFFKMPNEVIYISGLDPRSARGGDRTFMRILGRAAKELGFEPHIFCVGPQRTTFATDFGVIHQAKSPYLLLHRRMPLHAPLLCAEIERFLDGKKDPLLLHSLSVWGYVAAKIAGKCRSRGIHAVSVVNAYDTMVNETRAKLEGVCMAHGRFRRAALQLELLWDRLVIDPHEKKGYFGAQVVAVNYESVRRLLASSYGPGLAVRKVPYTSEYAFTHENAADISVMPADLAALRPADAPLVISVSRHDPRKGVDVLLRALARLRDRGVPFRACLVGLGPLIEAHRRLALELGLGDVTLITGAVPDPWCYLRHADVFVLPSIGEGSGSMSLIEALQAGVAVVASNVDGIPEDVTDSDSAMLVEPGNPAALAEAISRLLQNADLRKSLAQRGREVFEEKFSASVFTDMLGKLYADLGFPPPFQNRSGLESDVAT
jgi:glycosyltransferase involved in cell wall biosynthesis